MQKTLITLTLSAMLTLGAHADNKINTAATEVKQQTVQESLQLVGEGMMTYLFWDVYLARLYTKTGTYESKVSDTALEFNYELDIKSKALVEETVNQWRELDLDEHPEETQWTNALLEIWPDVNEGDQLLFHIDSDGNANFYYNSQFRGQIASPEFSLRFKSIWLGENTSEPKVRKKLMGDYKKKRKLADNT